MVIYIGEINGEKASCIRIVCIRNYAAIRSFTTSARSLAPFSNVRTLNYRPEFKIPELCFCFLISMTCRLEVKSSFTRLALSSINPVFFSPKLLQEGLQTLAPSR